MGFCYPLPYLADGARYFDSIAHRNWSIFLDSGPPEARCGRYDILVTAPHTTLCHRDGQMAIEEPGGTQILSSDDPLALIDARLPQFRSSTPSALPFTSGAVGYIGYDIGRCYESIPAIERPAASRSPLPELAVGLYHWALVIDHQQAAAWLVGDATVPEETRQRWLRHFTAAPTHPSPRTPLLRTEPLRVAPEKAAYAQAFHRVQHYIREGDCYQVNLARHFSTRVTGDPWEGYRQLRRLNPAPHAAYIKLPEGEIMSCSPERFLRVEQGRVESRPIKGTRPRSADPQRDAQLRQELLADPKERAENLMIVDLLRNDIGRCCRPGSIRVPALFQCESFRGVHHLVSSITGELADGVTALMLLRACFPGGSITGTPKIRAMAIIEALEERRRGVYCGTIGYFDGGGDMDSSIVIRTLTHSAGALDFFTGGGIVADSKISAEFDETLHKAAMFLQFLGVRGES